MVKIKYNSLKRSLVLISVFSIIMLIFITVSYREDDTVLSSEKICYTAPEKVDDSGPKRRRPAVSAEAVPWQWQYLPYSKGYLFTHERPVNGVAMGYFLPQKEINGLSMALIHAYNAKKTGFSMSMFEYSGDSAGFALFLAGGIQHNRGVSMGLWNMTEHNHGVQLGLINQEERNLLMEYDMKPAYNERKFGVQAGVINYSDAPGIQFGLWNTNPNSWIKHFPIFNICF